MSYLFAVVRRAMAHLTFFFATLRFRIFEWFQIRVLRTHKAGQVAFESAKMRAKDIDSIAVVAIYPRSSLLRSTKRLIQILRAADYEVLLVVNKTGLTGTWLRELQQEGVTALVRPNLGRDFGAFQSGIRHLQSVGIYESLKSLLIANDSVYYTPLSIKKLPEFVRERNPWSALFANLELHSHAQSFFVQFGPEILKTNTFRNFWKNYYPTSIRHNVINRGEIALSRALLQEGCKFEIYSTGKRLKSAIGKNKFRDYEKFALVNGSGAPLFNILNTSHEEDIFRMQHQMMLQNPTHTLGLLNARFLGTPIKLDLMRTGLTSLVDLEECFKTCGVEGEELQNILSEILAGGGHHTVKGWRRLWRDYGMG